MKQRVSLVTLGVRDKQRAGVLRGARSPEEVDAITETARQAGAHVGRAPAKTFWGGYSSVVIDPDGHPWEIAYNPGWYTTPDGAVFLSDG